LAPEPQGSGALLFSELIEAAAKGRAFGPGERPTFNVEHATFNAEKAEKGDPASN
jgi:hypothetical protein